MKLIRSCLAALLVLTLLAGCGDVDAEEDSARDAVGTGGILHFHANMEKPLSQGTNDLLISIRDVTTHAPFAGAVVDASALMPAMAHEAPHAAQIEERGDGTYVAHALALPMAGQWYVDVKASRGDTSDTVRFTYDIR